MNEGYVHVQQFVFNKIIYLKVNPILLTYALQELGTYIRPLMSRELQPTNVCY